MKKFIALYHNTTGSHQPAPEMTPEQQKQMLAPWNAWQAKYGERIVDFGAPLMPASSSTSGDAWSPTKNCVTGYSIVTAEDLEAAKEMFKKHPIYNHPNHAIEISECVEI